MLPLVGDGEGVGCPVSLGAGGVGFLEFVERGDPGNFELQDVFADGLELREVGGIVGFDEVRIRAFAHFAKDVLEVFSEISAFEDEFQDGLGLMAAFAHLQNFGLDVLKLAGKHLAVVDDEIHFLNAAAEEVAAFV